MNMIFNRLALAGVALVGMACCSNGNTKPDVPECKLSPDVRGKRFSAHGAEERWALGREERPSLEEKRCLTGEKTKKQAGHCARPAFIRLP